MATVVVQSAAVKRGEDVVIVQGTVNGAAYEVVASYEHLRGLAGKAQRVMHVARLLKERWDVDQAEASRTVDLAATVEIP